MIENELIHYGVKGMRWGVRRYQNKDGTLTPAGKKREMKVSTTKKAVARYNKKYEKVERLSDASDKKWEEVQELYRSLGRNRIQRMINASRKQTAASKKYNKAYDEWNMLAEKADAAWEEASKAYRDTGKNFISRVVNNVKYG